MNATITRIKHHTIVKNKNMIKETTDDLGDIYYSNCH